MITKVHKQQTRRDTTTNINLYVGLHFDVATSGICCVSLRSTNCVIVFLFGEWNGFGSKDSCARVGGTKKAGEYEETSTTEHQIMHFISTLEGRGEGGRRLGRERL